MEEFVYTGRGQTVPKDVVRVLFDPSVTEVEEEAFMKCKQLREVLLNDGLIKIGLQAFEYCTSLESITMPFTLIEIGVEAFAACNSLEEVVLHEGLKMIGDNAFTRCTSLESITFPSTIEEIGKYAFSYCRSLWAVELHEGLQTIGASAFYNCASLLERFTFPSISTRLKNVIEVEIEVNRTRLLNEIDAICGDVIERRGNELFVPGAVMQPRNWYDTGNWNTIKASLDQIVSWIRYYEIKAATTLFELALWKAKLDQVGDVSPTDREACRIEVPGPVKDAILQYL